MKHKLVFLELVRFLAALWVVGIHIPQVYGLKGTLWSLLEKTDRMPVMVFFLLSGFVISLRHLSKDEAFKDYLRARAARIYPVFITALVLTAFFASPYRTPGLFASNVFMIQGPTWFWHNRLITPALCTHVFGVNGPLWTLSMEWWFYMAFWPLKTYLPKVAPSLVLGASLVASVVFLKWASFPLMWVSLFGLWWAGAELAREYQANGRVSFKGQWMPALSIAFSTIAALASRRISPDGLNGQVLLGCLGSGLVFLFLWIACQHCLRVSFGKLDSLVMTLGGLSYALYATHFLVVTFTAKNHIPWPVTVVLSVALAWMVERFVQPTGSAWIKAAFSPKKAAKAPPDSEPESPVASPEPVSV